MRSGNFFWRRAPFIRLLIPFMSGIILHWYVQPDPRIWWLLLLGGITITISVFFFSLPAKFHFRVITGTITFIPFIAIGGLLAWKNDVRNDTSWVGILGSRQAISYATLLETPVEKDRSFKASAIIDSYTMDADTVHSKGKVLIYFSKDSLPPGLQYGSRIIFYKQLQEIKSQGNPGGFDYKRYSLFQGFTHQVFLQSREFRILPGHDRRWLPVLLEKIRSQVLNTLRKNIRGEKELGLAEALLIGYKNDLDKTLIQSYANTGVVHVIAISGLHLGLIYWLLAGLLQPLRRKKFGKWLRPLLIIAGLWIFSLLTGAQPSILRSAVMFTCIVLGENLGRKSHIYNTLAFSAFALLCYNPYWLWDIGFQLSYIAVLSIVVFMQPVYDLLYFRNKTMDLLWKMNAVTIAAQILTTPLSIYHFHQFPSLFLFTNIVAVPLSSVILLGEILLCLVFFFSEGALLLGSLISWLIKMMNEYIGRIEKISFSLWEGLQINFFQLFILYFFIAAISYWLLEKKKQALFPALLLFIAFLALRCNSFIEAGSQQKFIVYNVPRQQAIDLINGRWYQFRGDSSLRLETPASKFHLKPARTLFRIRRSDNDTLTHAMPFIRFSGKRILIVDKSLTLSSHRPPETLDILVISKNPRFFLSEAAKVFNINMVVFDGSVTGWKLRRWKNDCDSLHIPYHDVSENGAFVMNLN